MKRAHEEPEGDGSAKRARSEEESGSQSRPNGSALNNAVEDAKQSDTPMISVSPSSPSAAAASARSSFPYAKLVGPGEFESEKHFYPRVLNAQMHPIVASFLSLGSERIAKRYCHLHPKTDMQVLLKYLRYEPAHFRWSGSDLFNVADAEGRRQMVVIETNSCPSGQKSMPYLSEEEDGAGYHVLLSTTFMELIKTAPNLPPGALAVVYDKNEMEATGYAAEVANVTGEKIFLAEFHSIEKEADPPCRWNNGVLSVRTLDGEWHPCRAVFRYVTQKPWNRFPVMTRTLVLNPIIACLAGGRNKMVAAKAYDFFNADIKHHGLEIRTPQTIKDVTKKEIPLWLKLFGGHAVIKIPYSNAGQGVYTITSPEELKAFMAEEHHYDKFVVQSLIGNSKWSSNTQSGQYFHVGTIPNKKCQTYVADLRMMVGCTKAAGFRPIAIYARRARQPLSDVLSPPYDSWGMLGTNLSVKTEDGKWTTDTSRLLLMDRKDFNKLGLGIDDLIDAYVQTVLATIAIDKMAKKLIKEHKFNLDLFASLNQDRGLLDELYENIHKDEAAAFTWLPPAPQPSPASALPSAAPVNQPPVVQLNAASFTAL